MRQTDVLRLTLRGADRHVAAEVFFGHLADVCRGVDLSGGVVIEVEADGRVYVNGLYVPTRQERARRQVRMPLLAASGMR